MKKLLALLFIVYSYSANSQYYSVGDQAPEYVFTDIINKDAPLPLLNSGKIVILEFWATWCGPCIPALKKLDVLQAKYSDDLLVIGVSPDKRSRLVEYVEKFSPGIPIAYDTTFNNNFNFSTVPHAVMINRSGEVIASTNPQEITSGVINNLIDGESVNLSVKVDKNTRDGKVIYQEFNNNYQFVLRKSNGEHGPDRFGENEVVFTSRTKDMIYFSLYERDSIISIYDIEYGPGIDTIHFENAFDYSLEFYASESFEGNAHKTVLDILIDKCSWPSSKLVTRSVKSNYSLVMTENKLKNKTRAGLGSMRYGVLEYSSNSTLDQLVIYLSEILGVRINNEVNINGVYWFDLISDEININLEIINEALGEYGLQMVRKESSVEVPIMVLKN